MRWDGDQLPHSIISLEAVCQRWQLLRHRCQETCLRDTDASLVDKP